MSVREAAGEDDWRTYFAIYEDSLRRWGDTASSRYGWPLFAAMAARRSDHIHLWLAEFDGRVISGGICLSAAGHVAYWHAATLSDFFHLRPSNLLVSAMLADACGRGAEWFDFNPSGGHEGVRVFKERCGASPLPCPVVSTFETSARAGSALARGAGRIRSVVERRSPSMGTRQDRGGAR